MLSPAQIKETYLAEVDSGLIRYQGYPTTSVAVPVATDVELFAAAAGPLTDFWLCGFKAAVYASVAALTLTLTIGYGGVDGANPPATVVVTTFPIAKDGNAGTVGPMEVPTEMFPYPIRIPGGVRMAVITAAITGTDTIDEFWVILATAVGS